MNLKMNTADFTKHSPYPIHSHETYEIFYYTEGSAHLLCNNQAIHIVKNSISIIPPYTAHTHVKTDNLKYISITGTFENKLYFTTPVILKDNSELDGKKLIEMIYRNHMYENEYLLSLINSYTNFIFQNIKFDKDINITVSEIMYKILDNFSDYDFNIKNILTSSGYAEDYIRAIFKKTTGKTPGEYLSDVRMKHACYLMDVYKNIMPLSEVAERCGYLDYTYFSQKFKKTYGKSPRQYINSSS